MRLRTLVAAVLLVLPAAGMADDVSDELALAQKKYASGDVAGALESVRLVEAWLLEQQAEGLSGVFGEIEGWVKEIGEGQSAGMAMMGGGISADCRYTRDEQTMEANIIGQSPMLSMTLSMISNPMMASASGGKIVKIGQQKGMIKEDDGRWELMVPFQNTVLVTIRTESARQDAIACAEAIDWTALGEITAAN